MFRVRTEWQSRPDLRWISDPLPSYGAVLEHARRIEISGTVGVTAIEVWNDRANEWLPVPFVCRQSVNPGS